MAGVGAVLGFVPQMLGVVYLPCVSWKAAGIWPEWRLLWIVFSGNSDFLANLLSRMLIGTGCGVPGVMASRTIESERDRRMTVMTTTFIPCGAKMPIIALIAGALFGKCTGGLLSARTLSALPRSSSLALFLRKRKRLPAIRLHLLWSCRLIILPTVGNVLRSMWERGWSFIKKAGTIILLVYYLHLVHLQASAVTDGGFGMVEDMNNSRIWLPSAVLFAVIFAPLGWGNWRVQLWRLLPGLIAKENVVSTFGILYRYAARS